MLWVAREGPKDKRGISACAGLLRTSACMSGSWCSANGPAGTL